MKPDPNMPFWSIMKESHYPNRLFFTDTEYAQIFLKLKESGTSGQARLADDSGPLFRISGAVTADGLMGSVQCGLTQDTALCLEDRESLYHLCLGNGRTVLTDFYFPVSSPSRMDMPPGEYSDAADALGGTLRYFNVAVPCPIEASWAEIRYRNTVLHRIDRSATAPRVRVSNPRGGEQFASGTRVQIQWQADDDDGDAMAYSIQYSPNGGGTWHPVAAGLTAQTYEWNTAGSPGGPQGLIRVRAGDGFNEGEDACNETFALSGLPPVASIVQPTSGTVFLQWEHIPLIAGAIDPEGKDMQTTWTVTLEGDHSLTTSSLNVLWPSLNPGRHLARVEVKDQDGFMVSREVCFEILADSDRDGIADQYEEAHDLDPGNSADAQNDIDQDGLNNFEESQWNLDPREKDSDHDSWLDGQEVSAGSDPCDPNSRPTSNSVYPWDPYP